MKFVTMATQLLMELMVVLTIVPSIQIGIALALMVGFLHVSLNAAMENLLDLN